MRNLVVMFALICFESSVMAQTTGERTLPGTEYSAGQVVDVVIEVTGDPGSIIVVETVPRGWVIHAVTTRGGLSDGNVITWELDSFTGAKTFKYKAVAPSTSTGDSVFSGMVNDIEIVGMTTMTPAKPNPVGMFNNHIDVGEPTPGEATYDDQTGEYQIKGNGADIFMKEDAFHFAYSELTGSCSLKSKIRIENINHSDGWSKAALMIRNGLGPDSAHYMILVREEEQGICTHWREEDGAFTSSTSGRIRFTDVQDGQLEIIRVGKVIYVYYIDITSNQPVLFDSRTIDFADPVYAGLAVTSHSSGRFSMGHYNDVELSNFSAVTGRRVLSDRLYTPGQPMMVTIELTGDPGTITVVESPPADWTVSEISSGGQINSAGEITWTLPSFSGSDILTYVVTPSLTETEDGIFSGRVGDFEFIGESILPSASSKRIGIFENHIDFGDSDPGDATYDSSTGVYQVIGHSGGSAGGHWAFSEVVGPFSLKAKIRVENIDSSASYAGAGLTITNDLNYYPICYTASVLSDQEVWALWRKVPGYSGMGSGLLWTSFLSTRKQDGRIEIVREDKSVSMYYMDLTTGERTLFNSQILEFTDPVYVGLYSSPNESGKYVIGHFSDVELTLFTSSSSDNWELFR